MRKNTWRTLSGIAQIDDIYEQLRIEFTDPRWAKSKVYVGCDSQNLGKSNTSFVQVVCVHHWDASGMGKGGRVFFIRHIERRYKSLFQRLLREAEISIKLAQVIQPICSEFEVDFEVHADVNPKRTEGSYIAYNSVKGWIESMGFECHTKPSSWAASIVADVHVRGIRHSKIAGRRSLKLREDLEDNVFYNEEGKNEES
jgi:hypothetical protein